MNMVSKEMIEKATNETDLVKIISEYVKLEKSGANLKGLCPFHKEKTPSFTVSLEKRIYKCFGCGKGGNIIEFIMSVERKSFPDAVKYLVMRAEMADNDEIGTIYVLKLVENKYYVGFTTNLKLRIEKHFNGGGAEWTKRYKPIEVLETLENSSITLENEVAERYMRKFGYKNVRGGDYVFKYLNYEQTPRNYQKRKKDGVFLLELENSKYFVGFDTDMERSIRKHFIGNGNLWTQLHKPIKVLKRIKSMNPETQKQMTLAAMSEFGWENVRGYRWTDVIIKKPKELI